MLLRLHGKQLAFPDTTLSMVISMGKLDARGFSVNKLHVSIHIAGLQFDARYLTGYSGFEYAAITSF